MVTVLQDIRVLDFGKFISCPFAAAMLADMGAEVIRIDRPGGEGDRFSGLTAPHGENLAYASHNRNKKNLSLDYMNREKAGPVIDALVRSADVVMHNFSPAAAEMIGLTWENLQAINPRIILTSITCYGSEGPYAARVGFDFIAQAMSGAMRAGGFPDKEPIRAFTNPYDYTTAMAAAMGTLAALRHRDQTGEGQQVDLSLLQTALATTAPFIAESEVLKTPRPIIGNRVAYSGPSDMYEAKDGFVFVATIMHSMWKRLARATGMEDLIDDPDLDTDLKRYQNRERIDPRMARWVKERTVDEVLETLEAARIPCSRVMELDEIRKDPHVQEMGMVPTSDLGVEGLEEVPIGGHPVRFSKTPAAIHSRAPRVGEHNDEILAGLPGFDSGRIQRLQQEGII